MRTLVTGATGLFGKRLLSRLKEPVVLSRDPARARERLKVALAYPWLPEAGPPPAAAFEGVDVVISLAGEPIAEGRWTPEKKRRIRESRIIGTRNLVAGLAGLATPPRVLVSASAVGYYGDRGDEELDESSGPGTGFLAEVCAAWEKEAMAAEQLGMRVACIRTGIVLAPDGGALRKMLPLFRWGLGGRLGSGRQWMPWIHIDDVIGIILHAAGNERVRGPINACGPHPVTNAEFTRELGRALGRPTCLPAPAFMLRMVFGEMSSVLVCSQKVRPTVALSTNYTFAHTDLPTALRNLFAKPQRPHP